jgi:hypothetical protein
VLGLPKGKRASPCADEQRTICQVLDSVNLNLPMRYPYPALMARAGCLFNA